MGSEHRFRRRGPVVEVNDPLSALSALLLPFLSGHHLEHDGLQDRVVPYNVANP
jgi:hypothetical protein